MGCGRIFRRYSTGEGCRIENGLADPCFQPLDLTLLDKHFGNLTMWQNTVQEIHNRGMYVLLDNTMAT